MTKDLLEMILDKNIMEINQERLSSKNLELKLDQSIKNEIIEYGLTTKLGARPILDYIESLILDPLTDEILYGKYKNNSVKTVVYVSLVNGKVVF